MGVEVSYWQCSNFGAGCIVKAYYLNNLNEYTQYNIIKRQIHKAITGHDVGITINLVFCILTH